MAIAATQSIPEILAEHPETEAVFKRFGVGTRHEALKHESLKATCLVSQVDLDQLLLALNSVCVSA